MKTPTRKVFLGGLSIDTMKEEIMEVVTKYGDVVDVQIMTEKGTEKPRGFAFAIYKDYDGAERLVAQKFIKVHVSCVVP